MRLPAPALHALASAGPVAWQLADGLSGWEDKPRVQMRTRMRSQISIPLPFLPTHRETSVQASHTAHLLLQ